MNSKAQVFVPAAAQRLQSIVTQVLALQNQVQQLQQQWTQLGKQDMPGWTEIDWEAFAFTANELRAALNGLNDPMTMGLDSLQLALPKLQKIL